MDTQTLEARLRHKGRQDLENLLLKAKTVLNPLLEIGHVCDAWKKFCEASRKWMVSDFEERAITNFMNQVSDCHRQLQSLHEETDNAPEQ